MLVEFVMALHKALISCCWYILLTEVLMLVYKLTEVLMSVPKVLTEVLVTVHTVLVEFFMSLH